MNDDELKKHFDALRTTDQESAPSFQAIRGRAPKKKVRGWAWALPLAASLPLVLIAYFAIQPRADHVTPAHVEIPRVELADAEPLAFLLSPIPALEQTP